MKEQFEQLLRSTNRPGIENVIKYLSESDFYTAPASSKYHGNRQGGLAIHSMAVFSMMEELNGIDATSSGIIPLDKGRYPRESIILVGLLHDVCKIGHYEANVLSNNTISEKKPYHVNDKLPLGHGEKSCIILCRLGLELTDEELLAIRWHMNAFDDVSHYKCSGGWNKLSILTFLADYFASQFLEE